MPSRQHVLRKVAAGLALGAAVAIAPLAAAQQHLTAQADRVLTWSDSVWSTARSGEGESALDLLERLPEGLGELGLDAVAQSIDRYRANIAKREAQRAERMKELRDELDADLAIREALSKVLELHTLTLDKDGLLNEPAIRQITQVAHSAARNAEDDGRWLDAHYLINRLHVLFEDGRYRGDLDRLNQRLIMLNLYVPERLHAMRSELRVEQGEDPLPPYNQLGESWDARLVGVNDKMIVQAMAYAMGGHVYEASSKSMLLGGLDAVRTMATTTDLAAAMPSLSDAATRDRFLAELRRIRNVVVGAGERDIDIRFIHNVVKDLRLANMQTIDVDDRALLHEFGNGFAEKLDDYSAIIWPDEMRRFRQQTRGDFVGVGIQISLNDALELEVVAPISGTPAARAGIRAGDVIARIDGDDTTGIALSQAVDRITGDKGTAVTLSVRREGEDKLLDKTLIRDSIPLYATKGWKRDGPDEMDWDYLIDDEHNIGYVRLTRFNENTSSELRDALRELKQADLNGFVLDLRSNPGGLLTEAVKVTNLFIESGIIVTQEDRYGTREDTQRASRWKARLTDVPMIVLINGGSASASEIVAGALKDHGRAVVVGERSFGKGSVQNVMPIRGTGAAFKLTTQLYMLPDGESIHRDPTNPEKRWGVQPNVVVEMLPEQISDWLELRRDADVVQLNDAGQLSEAPVDPTPLIQDGIDVQLETAVLLLRNKIAVSDRVAELDDRRRP